MKLMYGLELVTIEASIEEIDDAIASYIQHSKDQLIFIEIDKIINVTPVMNNGKLRMVESFLVRKLTIDEYINKSIFNALEFRVVGDVIYLPNLGRTEPLRSAYSALEHVVIRDVIKNHSNLINVIMGRLDSKVLEVYTSIQLKKRIARELANTFKQCL